MGILDGRGAIVTGAGQGVGRGIALALADEGAHVAVLGRTVDKLTGTCAEIADRGGRAEPFECDVTRPQEIPSVVASVAEVVGDLHVLVNNAYAGTFGSLLDTEDEQFRLGFESGPFASLAFMRACHPYLRRNGGSIVNLVTSAMVRWDQSGFGAYAAAKKAVQSLTRTAASEWGSDGIRVNCIAPHAMSPGMAGWVRANPEEAEQFRRSIPLGRIGDPEVDVGRAVVQIVGPNTAYLTGATIPLDGGQAAF